METKIQKMALPNGEFTLVSPTGNHRTVQIRTQKEDAKFAPGSRIIALLTGPDNESCYTPFGFVLSDRITVWKSKQSEDRFFEKLSKMLWVMSHDPENNHYKSQGAELKQSRKCIICNRKLTDPISINMGIGPVCRDK